MIDTHCHLSMVLDENKNIDYGQIENTLKQMQVNGVTHAITIGSNMEDSKLSVEIANKYDNIYCAVGVHPEEVESFNIKELEDLIKANLDSGKLVAIGEIGLDYYWRKDNKDKQIEIFKRQIELAKKHNLPIIVHCRDAYGDVLDILKQYTPFDNCGVIHCYSGSVEWAKEVIRLGFLISFTGVVTYSNAVNVQEVAKWVDEDKFMVETDSPYLTPVPFRGKENQPMYVKYVAQTIAELRGITTDEVALATTQNAERIFNFNAK